MQNGASSGDESEGEGAERGRVVDFALLKAAERHVKFDEATTGYFNALLAGRTHAQPFVICRLASARRRSCPVWPGAQTVIAARRFGQPALMLLDATSKRCCATGPRCARWLVRCRASLLQQKYGVCLQAWRRARRASRRAARSC